MRLKDRVAIVTGGGHGIGLAIALRLASEGSAIVIAGPTKETIESAREQVTSNGGHARAVQTDVSEEAAVQKLVTATLAEFGRLDILVNNAGIAGPTALAVNVTREDWDRTIAINLTGAFLCSKYALPHMIERGGGRIINITSVAGLKAYALRSPYSASKWGMIGLTCSLADEVGRHNITVNAIAPGPIRGPRIESVIRNRAAELGMSFEEMEQEYVKPTALKRMAEEEDIAALTAFLASDEARNLTGQTIEVSAGYML
ncbi:MAG TPA: SDR family NAD(P)-dependent oxidoreductase [Blastocatellia bacterium]|nr:SDR family NAD(P)-dependent oxidoreductase [Blastocatellia bacterium]